MSLTTDRPDRLVSQPLRSQPPRSESLRPMPALLRTVAAALSDAARQVFAKIEAIRVRPRKRKELRLVETLALGGRRQIFLVVCKNQPYLVGAGVDGVGSIVPMRSGSVRPGAVRPGSVRPGAVRPGSVRRDTSEKRPQLVSRRGKEKAAIRMVEDRPEQGSQTGCQTVFQRWP